MWLLSHPFLNNGNHLLSAILVLAQFTLRSLQDNLTQLSLKSFRRHFQQQQPSLTLVEKPVQPSKKWQPYCKENETIQYTHTSFCSSL